MSFYQNWSLFPKIVVPLVCLGGVLIVVSIWGVQHQVGDALREEMLERAKALTNAVNYVAEATGESPELLRIVNDIASEQDVTLIVVAGGNPLEVIACNKNAWIGRPLTAFPLDEIVHDIETSIRLKSVYQRYDVSSDEFILSEHLLFAHPIAGSRLQTGAVLVRLDARRMQYHLSVATWRMGAGMSVALLAIVGLAYVLLRGQVLIPVFEIVKAMQLRRGGDPEARASVVNKDEVGLLSEALNEMMTVENEATQTLRQVITGARCLMWEASVSRTPREHPGTFDWDFKIADEDAAQALLPLDVPEGKTYTQMWHESKVAEDQERMDVVSYEALNTGQTSYAQEFRCKRKDGQIRWLLEDVHVEAVDDRQWRLVGICIDITDRKRDEEVLEYFNQTLSEKNEELESVIYAVSHDLRSPLVNIQGFSQELEHFVGQMRHVLSTGDLTQAHRDQLQALLEDELPEALDYIKSGAAKMDNLLKGLLAVSRIGRAAIVQESLDMNEMMGEIVKSFEFQVQQADAKVEIDVLPVCVGDAVQINQVFSNLLSNALKYRDVQRQCLIKISSYEDAERVVYTLADNGIGIAEEHRVTIFALFHRLDNLSADGDGLGLTICRRIISRHNGQIWVESTPNEGSTFFVALPKTSGLSHAL